MRRLRVLRTAIALCVLIVGSVQPVVAERMPEAGFDGSRESAPSGPVTTLSTVELAVDDTYLDADSPGSRNAPVGFLAINTAGRKRPAFKFEGLLSRVPPGSTVLSAQLKLTTKLRTFERSLTPTVHAIRRPWVVAEATWEEASLGNIWYSYGCDDTTVDRYAGGITLTPIDDDNATYYFDVTGLVQQWVSEEIANNGMIMIGSGGSVKYEFWSANAGGAGDARRPRLIVSFTPPATTPTPTISPTATSSSTPLATATLSSTETLAPSSTPTLAPTSTATHTPEITLSPTPTNGTVFGMVWEDLNANSIMDPTEPGLAGAGIIIRDQTQGMVWAFTTQSDGKYVSRPLSAGWYLIEEINPPGYTSTTSDSFWFEVVDTSPTEINFGDRSLAGPSPQPSPTVPGPATRTSTPTQTPSPTTGSSPTATMTQGPTSTPTAIVTPPTATPTPLFDMSQAIPVACGETMTGTTVGKSAWVSGYSCWPSYFDYSGPEVVHVFRAHVAMDLQARLVSAPTDLDVMILDSLDPDGCVAEGDHTALAEDVPPGWYYIVVDGFMGATGDYTLEVSCPGAPTPTPTNTLTPEPTPTFTPRPPLGLYNLPLVFQWYPSRPTPTPTPSVTPTPSFQYDVRVNCGEGNWPYTDSTGQVWETDRAYSPGGYGYWNGATFAIEARQISMTEDDFLYFTERAGGGYDFDVPPGNYLVELHFAEIFQWARGDSRVFDILLEDQAVLEHLDIYSDVGGYRYRAKVYTFEVRVTDDQLNQTYRHLTAATTGYYGKISAIRVAYLGP